MRLEDLQVIWDGQNQKPLYALTEGAIERLVQRETRQVHRDLGTMEIGMVSVCLLTGAISLYQGVTRAGRGATDLRTWITPALFLLICGFVVLSRRRRRQREHSYAATLLGDLEKSISQAQHHLWMSRTFPIWFLVPAAIDVALTWFLKDSLPGLGEVTLVLGAFLLSVLLVRRSQTSRLAPKLRELLALRDKLTHEEAPTRL